MRILIVIFWVMVCVRCKLRPPAVPLIVTDPYSSSWQMGDQLAEYTFHWAGGLSVFNGMLLLDGKCYRFWGQREFGNAQCDYEMPQVDVTVHPTRTEFRFQIDNILQLNVTFQTPARLDDIDLLALPLTYIDYSVRTLDSADHDVKIYYDNSPDLVLGMGTLEECTWDLKERDGINYMSIGTLNQVFNSNQNHQNWRDRISWGYFHVATVVDSHTHVTIARSMDMRNGFALGQSLPRLDTDLPRKDNDRQVAIGVMFDLGNMKKGDIQVRSIGTLYDVKYSMYYFGQIFIPKWKQQYKSVENVMSKFMEISTKQKLQEELKAFDKMVVSHLENSFQGSSSSRQKYGEIGSLAYRQVTGSLQISHNHIRNTSWVFMKEISSDGDISTVDVIYPSFPLFYHINPEIFRLLLEPILEYASDRAKDYGRDIPYDLPWAPHHLGTWPVCDLHQQDQEQMPIEETANLLILVQAMIRMDPTTYLPLFEPYFPLLDKWGNYLTTVLPDPGDQLCTDDFEGPSPHNINLAIKGIIGVAAYSQHLEMRGQANHTYYMNLSKVYVQYLLQHGMDQSGTHLKLQYDKEDTWSLKYNLAMQEVLGLQLISQEVIKKELDYYFTKANEYGIPLDSRADFTKTDWLFWVAAIGTDSQFEKVVEMVYDFYNETWDRVPMTDWHETKMPQNKSFRARPVVGGFWLRVLLKQLNTKGTL